MLLVLVLLAVLRVLPFLLRQQLAVLRALLLRLTGTTRKPSPRAATLLLRRATPTHAVPAREEEG